MNDDELGVQILSSGQMFVSDSDLASMFSENGGENHNEGEENKSLEDEEHGDSGDGDNQDNNNDKDIVIPEGKFEPDKVSESSNDYKKSLLSLSKLGIIAEISDDSLFAGDDGEESSFSDLKIDDEETYLGYVKLLHEEKEKKLLENKADLSGVSDLAKKIIELDKSGGDITSILKAKAQALDPISNLDLDVVDNQKITVAHYLSCKYDHMSDNEIKDFVDTYEARGVLAEKALESKAALDKIVNDLAEKQKAAVEEERKVFAEKYKGYRKSVKESISSKFQLKDDYVKKLVDYGTKLDDRNSPELLGRKYEEMLQNPEEAADLILFLYDKEEYLKQKTNKAVSEERRNVFKKLTTKSKKTEASTADVVKDDEIDESRYIPLKGNVIMR